MKIRYTQLLLLVLVVLSSCKAEWFKEPKTQLKVSVYDYEGLAPFLNEKDDVVYVVNFWATWCKPCVEELPAFEKLLSE